VPGSALQLGDAAQAAQTYQMALVLDPKLVDAHVNLGNLHKVKLAKNKQT
jgi:hypothetical protein